MTDLENMLFLKLRPVTDRRLTEQVAPLLCEGEAILQPFQGLRDGVVFTDRRVIAVNTQGFTGRKKTFVSLPYSRIHAFSVESAGVLDLDSEIQLWFAGLGLVTFELTAGADLASLARLIGEAALA